MIFGHSREKKTSKVNSFITTLNATEAVCGSFEILKIGRQTKLKKKYKYQVSKKTSRISNSYLCMLKENIFLLILNTVQMYDINKWLVKRII